MIPGQTKTPPQGNGERVSEIAAEELFFSCLNDAVQSATEPLLHSGEGNPCSNGVFNHQSAAVRGKPVRGFCNIDLFIYLGLTVFVRRVCYKADYVLAKIVIAVVKPKPVLKNLQTRTSNRKGSFLLGNSYQL